MKNMNQIGGKLILWGLILAMLTFTAIRTIHFLQLTFPPDQQYVAYLGLAAFDIGVLGWFYYATQSAEGAAQRAIAYGMIFICAGGVIATTIVDMTIVSSENGVSKLPQDIGTLGVWSVIIVIVLNFLAGILVHLADPKHLKHFEMQNAKDVIHNTTMQHIKQQANTIAPQIAAQVAQYWATQVTAEMTGQIPGGLQVPQLPAPVVPGTAHALPQTVDAPKKQGLIDKAVSFFGGNKEQEQPSPAPAVSHAQNQPQVMSSSFTENLEQLYKNNPDMFAQFVQAARDANSPLANPVLDPSSQNGTENGHNH